MKPIALVLVLLFVAVGCATVTPPPQWTLPSEAAEAEYGQYLKEGAATLSGQAFLTQQNGTVIKAAGRTVTLDPATSIGNEWWEKAGKLWVHRTLTPPSPFFSKARRSTIADADGKFRFQNLAAGKYYVRTEVTWEIGNYNPTQGGLVGQEVQVKDSQTSEVILNSFPK
jgi:hypothetical protein